MGWERGEGVEGGRGGAKVELVVVMVFMGLEHEGVRGREGHGRRTGRGRACCCGGGVVVEAVMLSLLLSFIHARFKEGHRITHSKKHSFSSLCFVSVWKKG